MACMKSEMVCCSGLSISKWKYKHGFLFCSWSLHTRLGYICLDGGREASIAQPPLDEQGTESEERREGLAGQAGLQPCSNVWAVCVQADVPS